MDAIKTNWINRFGLLALFFILLFFFTVKNAVSARDSSPNIVLLTPFTMHSAQDLSFLQKGIEDMLVTRLAKEKEIIVLTEKEVDHDIFSGFEGRMDEESARTIAKRVNADYVVFGSITVFGTSISTDAKCISVNAEEEPVIFHATGTEKGQIIPHIGEFAKKINQTFFHLPSAAPVIQKEEDTEIETRKNPETLWRESRKKETEPQKKEVTPEKTTKTPVVPMESREATKDAGPLQYTIIPKSPENIIRSREMEIEIRSLTLGDVDGDGHNEIIYCDKNQIFIDSYETDGFVRMKTIPTSTSISLIGVDAADINGNGKAEIFVTQMSDLQSVLKSYVMEYTGTRFKTIADEPRWYYRVVHIPGKGGVLYGEQRSSGSMFSKGVHKLQWNQNAYVSETQLMLPSWAHVFGMAKGDILNNNQEEYAAFTENGHIRILDSHGEEIIRSSESFGGSLVYLEIADPAASPLGVEKEMIRYYLPQRIHLYDLNKDGKTELIVPKNEDKSGGIFAKLRFYRRGHIESLTAEETVGFYLNWKTWEISGFISDFAIGDVNRDGKKELVFAVVRKHTFSFRDPKSYIAFHALEE